MIRKLLIVGSDEVYAIENFYLRYLKVLDVEVRLFPAVPLFYQYYNKSIVNKIAFKSGLSSIYNRINKQFLEAVEEYKPDAIWIFKGMEIAPGSLQLVREKKIRLVNYNPDNPFIFSGKGSGNQNVTDSIPLYDLHLTYHHGVKSKLEKDFQLPAAILPFGFDDDDALFRECEGQQEIIKLCFLGNPDHRRVAFIDALASKGIEIDLFGNGWSKLINKANIGIFQPAYGVEQWKVLRRYRAQLNLMRIHNDDSHNMRSFEVPGIGGIMVAPDTIDHRRWFENGYEVLLYSGVDDCAGIVKELLKWPQEIADNMRMAARKRSIASNYSYRDRASQALADMNRFFYGKESQVKAAGSR